MHVDIAHTIRYSIMWEGTRADNGLPYQLSLQTSPSCAGQKKIRISQVFMLRHNSCEIIAQIVRTKLK